MPTKYHVNNHGEAKPCTATKRACRFGDGNQHYDTLQEARNAYESTMTESTQTPVKTIDEDNNSASSEDYQQEGTGGLEKLSILDFERQDVEILAMHELILYRAEAHSTIIHSFRRDGVRQDVDLLIHDRRRAEERIKELAENASVDDGIAGEVHSDLIVGSDFRDGYERFGYINDELTPDAERDEINERLLPLSRNWVRSLSSAEAAAVFQYTLDSRKYAFSANGEDRSQWAHFDDAVSNAPTLKPFVAYSGVNRFHVESTMNKIEEAGVGGEIEFDRVLSSSVNPAIVNSFAESLYEGEDGFSGKERTLVLEVLTDRGASVGALSAHPQEMEVLLPRGKYEVVGMKENVSYYWGVSKMGRTMTNTVSLKLVEVYEHD